MYDNRPLKIFAYYVGGFLLINFVAVILYLIIDMGDETATLIRVNSITNILFYGTLYVLFLSHFFSIWKDHLTRQNWTKTLLHIMGGFAAMFVAMIGLGYLYDVLNITESPENQVILDAQLNGPLFDKVALVLFAVFFAPLVEEFVFRYAGFGLFERVKNTPPIVPLLVTSFLFGGMHIMGDQLEQIIYYFGLGLILGYIYMKSNNIVVPVVVHMLFNAFVTITMFIGV